MKITIKSETVDTIIVESPEPFKVIDKREKHNKADFTDTKDDSTYGYPLDSKLVGYIYSALVANGYIDIMDYNSFHYYFNCNAPRPEKFEKIQWLKPSREGVRILLLMAFDRFLSHKRDIKKLQKEEIERLTPLFWVDIKGNPLHTYKRSGGFSRLDADELEEILVRIIQSYYSDY